MSAILSPEIIIAAVAGEFGVGMSDVKGLSRLADIVLAGRCVCIS